MGALKTVCLKIVYSETKAAENLEGSSTPAGNSRIFLVDFVLYSDWLMKFQGFSCSILIDRRQVVGFLRSPSVFGDELR